MVFPFTHIGGITWLFTSLQFGCVNLFVETFDPATTVPYLAANGVTMAGAGTPFHMVYLAAQRAAGPGADLPRRPPLPGWRRAQAPHPAPGDEGRVGRGRHLLGLRPDRGPDPRAGRRGRPRRGKGRDGGQADAGRRAQAGHARRHGGRPRRGGRDPGQGTPDDAGLPGLLPGRRRLRRGRLVPHRRPRPAGRRRLPHHHRAAEGHHHPQHGEHLGQRGRGPALRAPPGRATRPSSACRTSAPASGWSPSWSPRRARIPSPSTR